MVYKLQVEKFTNHLTVSATYENKQEKVQHMTHIFSEDKAKIEKENEIKLMPFEDILVNF